VRCAYCDHALVEFSLNNFGLPQDYTPGTGTEKCRCCGASLCTDKHPTWPKEHPYTPACDLWSGHPGMHRCMHSTRIREDFVWGEGEVTWEHGRLIETTKFTGYGPDASQEVPCFYDGQGKAWGVDDLIPDGSGGQLGDWTITVTFQPKEPA
jgi:hypothetical protein